MKYIFSFLLLLVAHNSFSQEMRLSVFIRDEVINVTVGNENENSNKTLELNKAQFSDDDVLKIQLDSDTIDKDWKRSFYIYDKQNNSVCDFTVKNNDNYFVQFGTLKKLLKPLQEYFIYTTALPADPNKAMMVKAGKQLVCKIKIQ